MVANRLVGFWLSAAVVSFLVAQGCGDSSDGASGATPDAGAGNNDGGAAPDIGGASNRAGTSAGGEGGQLVDPSGGHAAGGTEAVGGSDGPSGGQSGAPSGVAGDDTGGAAGAAGAGGAAATPNCEPIAKELAKHLDAMATKGWTATNRTNGMAMYGCSGAADVRGCLSDKPSASSTVYGAQWNSDTPGWVLRVLRQNDYSSSYVTAVSADGRFVAHGGTPAPSGSSKASIIDLQRNVLIPTGAAYDPAFFPDNNGFTFGGGTQNNCRQSVLTSNPSLVTMTEEGCVKLTSIGLQNRLAKLLDDGPYLSVDGNFENDNGGHNATLQDPEAQYAANASVDLVPMVFDGTKFAAQKQISVAVPFEGDPVLSASGNLLVTRVAGEQDKQAGYQLRRLTLTPSENTYVASVTPLTKYCLNGGAPSFSYDERWLALHHYVQASDAVELGYSGSDDPAFQAYLTQGASNIYLLDVLTGETRRITRMQPGQYALYPSFRSDGWLYFMVRVAGTTTEYVVASDAALASAGL